MEKTEKTKKAAQKCLQLIGEALSTGNMDVLDKIIVEEYIQHDPDCPDGLSGLKEFFTTLLKNYPDFEFEPKGVFADGDIAFLLSFQKYNKDHAGVFVVDIWRFENDMLVEHWDATQEIKKSKYHDNEHVFNYK